MVPGGMGGAEGANSAAAAASRSACFLANLSSTPSSQVLRGRGGTKGGRTSAEATQGETCARRQVATAALLRAHALLCPPACRSTPGEARGPT